MTDVKEVVEFSRLVSNILLLLLENSILTQQTVIQSNWYTYLVSLLKKVSTSLQDLVKKDGFSSIGSVLTELKMLFDLNNKESKFVNEKNKEIINVMASVQRMATPSRLIDLLLDISNDKVLKMTVFYLFSLSFIIDVFHQYNKSMLSDTLIAFMFVYSDQGVLVYFLSDVLIYALKI